MWNVSFKCLERTDHYIPGTTCICQDTSWTASCLQKAIEHISVKFRLRLILQFHDASENKTYRGIGIQAVVSGCVRSTKIQNVILEYHTTVTLLYTAQSHEGTIIHSEVFVSTLLFGGTWEGCFMCVIAVCLYKRKSLVIRTGCVDLWTFYLRVKQTGRWTDPGRYLDTKQGPVSGKILSLETDLSSLITLVTIVFSMLKIFWETGPWSLSFDLSQTLGQVEWLHYKT